MNTAKATRLRKEAYPQEYCRDARCLWFTGRPDRPGSPCRKHDAAAHEAWKLARTAPWLCHRCGWDNAITRNLCRNPNCMAQRVGNEDREWPSAKEITQGAQNNTREDPGILGSSAQDITHPKTQR